MEDRDFIDFEFNGHWASEFNLLAVSNSDRYSNSFYGTVNANTADMVGKYGVYKWKTQIGEKRFSINIAYDNVDLNTLRKIKEWLNPFVIGKLVFKEEPYKYYWVSLAEDPEISFLPFLTEETVVDGRRLKKGVYKGEFVINFVCFDNYGYSDWNSFDENYDYIVKELEISDDEVNFDDGSDNSLIISQIDGNLKQNKESQAYYSTSQESNSLTLNNITNTDTEKWSIKGGNSQVVQNYNSIQVEGESFNLNDVDNSKTMDIQLKGNHNQETREGYNLLENKSTTQTKNGVTITKNTDGTLVVKGTATSDFTFLIASNIVLENGKKYRLSGCPAGGDNKKYALTMNQYYENQSHYTQDYGSGSLFTYNELLANTNSVYIRVIKDVTYNNLIFKPMIIAGESTKEYEQYGATPSLEFPSEIKAVKDSLEVKVVNKNFVKIDETIDFSISNVQFTYKDGKLNLNGTSNANISSVNNNFKNYFKFVLPAGSYTYSQKNSVNSNIFTYILDLEDTSKRYATANGNSVKKVSFTLEKTTEVFVGMYSGSNVTFNNVETELQIEKGLTATDFVEHQEQTITMPVQQEMLEGDYFDWKNEKEVHSWNKKIFDGTENINISTRDNSFLFRLTDILSNIKENQIPPIICNMYKTVSWQNRDVNNIEKSISQYGLNVGFDKGDLTTVEEFKALLKSKYDAGTPVEVYYKLATSNKLDFRDEQKAVAKQFKAIVPYKDITHIYSTDEITPKMVVDYNITRTMPSLDYPSEIKTVGGNINLFDGNFIKAYLGGTSYKQYVEDSSCRSIIIPCEANTTYTITKRALSNRFIVFDTSKIPENKQDVDRNIVQNNNALSLTVTTSSTAKYLIVYVSSTEEEPEIKIEKGSTATSYSQYGQGCISITVYNKNLFKEISNNKKTNTAYGYLISGNYMLEKGKKYAVSFDTNNNGGKVYLNENVLKFVGSIYDAACDGKRHTIIATAIVDGFQRNRNLIKTGVATTDYYDVSNVSVCEYVNSSSSDFVEHQEQVFSMPVQQDMLEGDYFDFDREKEIHDWNKLVLTGDENWATSSLNVSGYKSFYCENLLKNVDKNDTEKICTHFKTRTFEDWFNLTQDNFIENTKGGTLGIRISDNLVSDLNTFKNLIKDKYNSGDSITIYYKTDTQTELNFTNEQKTVARQLKRSNFYKGTTNVILDNDLAKVKVNYDGYDGAPSEKHPSSVDGVKSKVDIIISNQNLFNFNKLNTSNSNLTIANNKLNGNNSVAIIGASNDSKGLLNKILVPGTYTVSFDILSKTDNWINSAFLCCQNQQKAENYANGISVNLIANEKKRASFQFEVKEKMTQFGIVFYLSKASEYEVSNITMVKGTEEDYIEYKQQQISLPVQEEMYIGDYIDETGEHHKMAKIVIDGTNTRVSMTKKPLNNYIQTYLSTSEQFDPQVDINCYSNIMNQEYNARFGFINTFIKGKTGIYFHFKGDLLGDADCNDIGMNNWFKEQYDKGTPAYIIGPLKKEKVLPLADEQKSALNILKNYTYSYPGANTISISGDTKPKITASYIPQQDINIDFILEGSNLLNDSAFYYNNDIYLKAFDEIDSGNPSTSGISSERGVYLYNAGNADASLKLTFDLIIPAENSPLTIVTSKGRFTKNGFEEINNYSQFSISNFAHYKPFVDIFDGVLSNWVIEIDSDLCEVYLKHKTNKDKVISLNRFNDNQSFLKLAGSDFVDYSKSFPTSLEEIKDSAIENTIFNKISLKESAQNYRLKNVSLDWKHTYL